jgi:cytidyltransferase-like protein
LVAVNDRSLLGAVFALGLTGGIVSLERIAGSLGSDAVRVERRARELQETGYVEVDGRRIALTKKGRSAIRVVFVGGGFEIIHPGHLHTLEEAKKLGDVLIVIVARDSTIRRRKGREPVSSETERLHLLGSLRQVDAAILGVEGDIYNTLERVKPDVVALGYDQHHTKRDIAHEAEKRGMKLRVVRLGAKRPGLKTSKLLLDT